MKEKGGWRDEIMGRGIGLHLNCQVLENPLVTCGALLKDSAFWEDLFIHSFSCIHSSLVHSTNLY